MMLVSKTVSIVSLFLVSLLQGLSNGEVLINEVSVTSITGVCNGLDYVELINNGTTAANLSGWLMHDKAGPTSRDAFTFPSQFSLAAGEIRLMCRNWLGSFAFDIDSSDTITLSNSTGVVVSTTGVITGGSGSKSDSYTFTSSSNTWSFLSATPGSVNGVTPSIVKPIINEVAVGGTSNSTAAPCFGTPFVEIYNDAFTDVNLAGYNLIAGSGSIPLSGNIGRFSFFTTCVTIPGFIGKNDNVELLDPSGKTVSSTGPIGDSSPRSIVPDLSWVRVTDLVLTATPFAPFYQYSTSPTPNKRNIFPFVPVQLPVQSCGSQTRPLSMASDYVLESLKNISVNGGDPKLAGGVFDPRTCSYVSVGRAGEMLEVSFVGDTASLVRRRPLFGGSQTLSAFGAYPDAQGVCFYRDAVNGDKLAIIDQEGRSVHICDIPGSDQLVPLFLGSSNCRVAQLSPEQIANSTLVSPDAGQSFAGIACDPTNGKIYVGSQQSPRLIWSLDYASGVYDVLFNMEDLLDDWGDCILRQIDDMTYDPIGQMLYILGDSEIYQSTLNGTLIGTPLSIQLEVKNAAGLSFEPNTGDLIIFSLSPSQIARYVPTTKAPTTSPTKTPTETPVSTNAPTEEPTKAPSNTPTKAPTKAPTTSPTKTPTETPVSNNAPTKAPTKAPSNTPTKSPTKAPSATKRPTASPTKVPAPVPVPVPVKTPTKAPVNVPSTTSVPVSPPTTTTTEICGIFGFNIFCPRRGNCGFLKRLVNFGNCK